MSPAVTHALIHRARILTTVRDRAGARNAQGEYEGAPVQGPWFAARRMTKRQSLETPEDGGQRRRSVTGYSLMWGTIHEDLTPLIVPVAADRVEVIAHGVSEVWEITGEPLVFDTGAEVFGGQAEIERVADSA